jgi:hypothetical protein
MTMRAAGSRARGGDAVQARHRDVHQHDVRSVCDVGADGGLAVGALVDWPATGATSERVNARTVALLSAIGIVSVAGRTARMARPHRGVGDSGHPRRVR